MKTTVIIPAYGRREFLMDALRSVANQIKPADQVIVVKNFYDEEVDGFIERNKWMSIEHDKVRYGEFIAPAIEETKGDVILFLEDDDVFEKEKVAVVRRAFLQRGVSYVHDTRLYLIEEPYKKFERVLGAIKYLEYITPKEDIIINTFERYVDKYLIRYRGIISTISLMSIRTECIRGRIPDLKGISISLESFIPAIASECGLLYHTKLRLTRYRIHSSSSISFTSADELRVLRNYARAVQDHEMIIGMLSPGNNLRNVIRYLQVEAKLILLNSGFMTFKSLSPKDFMGLCKNSVKTCLWVFKSIIRYLIYEMSHNERLRYGKVKRCPNEARKISCKRSCTSTSEKAFKIVTRLLPLWTLWILLNSVLRCLCVSRCLGIIMVRL